MRGKRALKNFGTISAGLIPACAGKTSRISSVGCCSRAHPRVCGENVGVSVISPVSGGSSPRVRGKLPREADSAARHRLIPACAGKTGAKSPATFPSPAHPRVCGENSLAIVPIQLPPGSSPRVRGKPRPANLSIDDQRLIPACAGKTEQAQRYINSLRAHPRVCGENTERSGVLTLRSVRSWKTLSFPPSLKVTHCRAFVQLSLSRIRL